MEWVSVHQNERGGRDQEGLARKKSEGKTLRVIGTTLERDAP